MSERARWRPLSYAVVVAAVTAAGCSGDDGGGGKKPPADDSCSSCTLKEAGERAGLRVGVAIGQAQIEPHGDLVAAEFDALSPEGELVWDVVHPEPDRWDFAGADALLDYAAEHGMTTRASHFAWDQDTKVTGTPDWVLRITDPDELERTMRDHLAKLTERYGEKITRWNVVNEPLEYTGAGRLNDNHYYQVLGPDYLERVFRIADELAPDSELWINEIFTESNPDKSAFYVQTVKGLVDEGVRIDGAGLQGHLFPGEPDFALVEKTLGDLAALGVKVALTEVDAPVSADEPNQLEIEADRMAKIVGACLAVPACESITFWGLHDGLSWLNWLLMPGLAPLLFDEDLERKPAYFAVRDALAKGRPGG